MAEHAGSDWLTPSPNGKRTCDRHNRKGGLTQPAVSIRFYHQIKAPLLLSRLCKIQIQNMTDCCIMRHDAVPERVLNTNPIMEELSISCNGILKLLQNLKPFKAAGPDKLKPLMIKELREEIAPIIQVILSTLSRQASSQQTGVKLKSPQFLRMEPNLLLPTADPYP